MGGPGGQLAGEDGQTEGGGSGGQGPGAVRQLVEGHGTATGQSADGEAYGLGCPWASGRARVGKGEGRPNRPGRNESAKGGGRRRRGTHTRTHTVTYYIQKPHTWAMIHGLVDAVVGGRWPGPPSLSPPYVPPATDKDAARAPPRHRPVWPSRQLPPWCWPSRPCTRTRADGDLLCPFLAAAPAGGPSVPECLGLSSGLIEDECELSSSASPNESGFWTRTRRVLDLFVTR